MKNIKLLFLVMLLICFSCKNKKMKKNQIKQIQIEQTEREQTEREQTERELAFYADTSNSDIFILNDNAVKLLQESQQNNYNLQRKETLLKEALTYLNTAIQKDSSFYYAYLNQSAVYRGLGQYDKAIKSLKELLSRKKHPQAIFVLGLIYEKQGKQKLAHQKYKDAYNAYLEYMKSPLSTAGDEVNKDYVLLFLEGKEKVLERINLKLKKDPKNIDLLIDKSIIERFNREEFIRSF